MVSIIPASMFSDTPFMLYINSIVVNISAVHSINDIVVYKVLFIFDII